MIRWPALVLIALLAACGPQAPETPPAVKAFTVTAATPGANGVTLSGEAPSGAEVRAGQATARADETGRWRLDLPAGSQPRSFTLYAQAGETTQQTPGPVVVLPDGGAALLRPGEGATWLGASPVGGQTHLLTADYDAAGGVIVSGRAPPQSDILIRIASARRGGGDSDAAGRFSIVLDAPLTLGRHAFEVSGGASEELVVLDLTPPRPPAPQTLAVARAEKGWRVDWITPSGGVQTTLLIGDAR